MPMSEHGGKPVAPGCEIADQFCADECHCWMGSYCATHQDEGEEWPCHAQMEYEQTGDFLIQRLSAMNVKLTKLLQELADSHDKLTRDHARLTRIVEHALVPFMRDAMPPIGGALQISWGIGDTESLLGCDVYGDVVTFNRGRAVGSKHGITYTASDGTEWVNGVRTPRPLDTGSDDGGESVTRAAGEDEAAAEPTRNHGSDDGG